MFFNEIILLIPAGEILSALFHQHRKFRGQGQWQSSDPPIPLASSWHGFRVSLESVSARQNACQHGHRVRVVQWNYSRPEPEVSSSQSGILRMTRGWPAEMKLVEVSRCFCCCLLLKVCETSSDNILGSTISGRSSVGATTPASSRITTSIIAHKTNS